MKHNGFEYVDLGLPSGTKWATCNVGANSEIDNGLYFAWGETVGYNSIVDAKKFSWDDYKFSKDGSNNHLTKYNSTDGKAVLDLEDDAANFNMGGRWHIPSNEQFKELVDENNVMSFWFGHYNNSDPGGILLISRRNGKQLFFPACGNLYKGELYNTDMRYGHYWCSSCDEGNKSKSFCFSEDSKLRQYVDYRSFGFCIRGVFNTFWI